jgi:hypothetical protein
MKSPTKRFYVQIVLIYPNWNLHILISFSAIQSQPIVTVSKIGFPDFLEEVIFQHLRKMI